MRIVYRTLPPWALPSASWTVTFVSGPKASTRAVRYVSTFCADFASPAIRSRPESKETSRTDMVPFAGRARDAIPSMEVASGKSFSNHTGIWTQGAFYFILTNFFIIQCFHLICP